MNYLRRRIVIILILFFPFCLLAKETYKYDLAVCAIFQNEAKYLKEWIEFHKLVGVKHFYLYNNLSTDNYQKVLAPYVESGEVELLDWEYAPKIDGPNWNTIQISAYMHAIQSSKKVVKWLAILDTDEFLFPVGIDDLPTFLLDYEEVAALCVNWQMYGTSGVKKILSGHLLIEDLIYKAPTEYEENIHVKSIVRPKFVWKISDPHCCSFLPGHYQVNADMEPFDGPYCPVKVDKIRINHYWTRDEHFFVKEKIPRRKRWGDNNYELRADNINKIVDTAIHKYVAQLKQKLGE